ncbi:DUF943 family protein [Rosenbergiella sp. S61]|uniref:DUF943 family protein n=1 Tax=Rosenbergiella gaditana TaxID=2726987 RepID=A0ABS5SV12_9GAMM|nr:DUF943 family protein [Rosenbergiella gaditana]MBT0723953.1 DUF943 family protein [Rosenbergiella gaditana]
MKTKNKKTLCALLLVAVGIFSYSLWLPLRPVDIIAVHHRGHGSSAVLVKNFPFTDKGKMSWWLKNKDVLKDKHKIPSPASDGSFVVVFWDFGDGYKETDGYDNLCFNDMKPPMNCIEKNSLLMVRNSENTGSYFVLDSGTYRMNNKGDIVKNKSD